MFKIGTKAKKTVHLSIFLVFPWEDCTVENKKKKREREKRKKERRERRKGRKEGNGELA